MNEKKLESLSALMDGESLEMDRAALDDWTRDEGLRAAWGRYHLISECVRGTLPRHMDPALAGRIAVALRSEPVILAPEATARRPWLKPLAGMAIAASVATLAVVGIQVNRGQDAGATGAMVAESGAGNAGSGGQVTLAAGAAQQVPTPVAVDPRLNRYLIKYSGPREGTAVEEVPSTVRIVTEGQPEQR